MLTVEKSSQTLVFFVIDNFVKSLLQNLGLKKRRQRKSDAREQLVTIIKLFDKEGIDRKHYKTIALICFQNKEPRIIDSSVNSYKAIFLEKYKVHLEDKNVISF